MRVKRLLASGLLLTSLSIAAAAQPTRNTLGARSTGIPYYVEGGVDTSRGTIFVVTTTVDEQDFSCDPTVGAGLSLREALEDCSSVTNAATIYVPAGQYLIDDDLDSSYDTLNIIGEDPLTTIIENTFVAPVRNDGNHFGFSLTNQSVSISNLTLRSGENAQLGSMAGSLDIYGSGQVNLYNLLFEDNVSTSGGAIYIVKEGFEETLTVTGSHLTFIDNGAPTGGAIYFTAIDDEGDATLTIYNSLFTGNSALIGGAIYTEDIEEVLIQGSLFIGNTAPGVYTDDQIANDSPGAGGAAYLDASEINIVNSQFTGNSAGQLAQGGYGGGLALGRDAVILNTLIEDNTAYGGSGDDCFDYGTAALQSLGGSALTSTEGCSQYVPALTDQYENLLANGGFESANTGQKTASGWTLTAGDVTRTCNKTSKTFTIYGNCALAFTGGGLAGKASFADVSIGQDLEMGDIVTLFAVSKGNAATRLSLAAVVLYSDGSPKQKFKVKFNGVGTTSGYDAKEVSATITSNEVGTVKVSITDNSTSGKAYIDRVYLFVSGEVVRDVAPPPAAPAAFRGGS